MTERLDRAGLQVDAVLARFVEDEALPGTGVEAGVFWSGFSGLLADFAPQNRALLAKRAELQAKIDAWHVARRGQPDQCAAREDRLVVGVGVQEHDGACRCRGLGAHCRLMM